jgi:hypothetical protein
MELGCVSSDVFLIVTVFTKVCGINGTPEEMVVNNETRRSITAKICGTQISPTMGDRHTSKKAKHRRVWPNLIQQDRILYATLM